METATSPNTTTEQLPELSGATTMSELLASYPGAQRAMFAAYHIGGCSSCGFRPDETLAEVCERNENLPVDEVIAHVRKSHDADARIQISPQELEAMMRGESEVRLVDVRTREEFEAVKIPGAHFMGETLLQEIFSGWDKEMTIVVYDHTGNRSMDAAAYLLGHGYGNTKSLLGGIDAYSREIDKALPRYRVEVE